MTGEGIGELLDLFAVILRNRRIYFEKIFAYRDAGRIQTIRKSGQLLSEEYQDDGIHVKAYVPVELFEELYRLDEFRLADIRGVILWKR